MPTGYAWSASVNPRDAICVWCCRIFWKTHSSSLRTRLRQRKMSVTAYVHAARLVLMIETENIADGEIDENSGVFLVKHQKRHRSIVRHIAEKSAGSKVRFTLSEWRFSARSCFVEKNSSRRRYRHHGDC